MKEVYGIQSGPTFRTMTLQGEGGTRRTIEHAHAMIKEMLPHANEFGRRPVSVGEISLALQCGGSDGYSGITANPALGHCADLLVRNGGTAILSETPEIYGAEHLLTRRAVSQEVADKLIERIHWWEEYCERNGGEMNNNPVARQQGGRAHHHPREVAGGGRQGRHHQPRRRLQICRADHPEGLRLHGQPRLRPGLGHGPGGLGRQRDRVHHRPRLLLRLQADAVAQDRHQHRHVPPHGRRHGHQRRHDRRRRGDDRAGGPSGSSTSWCAWPAARSPSPRSWAWATTSSCPGRSVP